jgi:archaellum biogenesis protein FlaJ (TadC family)
VILNLGQIWAANIYVEEDRPLYHKGNSVLVALNILILVLIAFAKVYYILRNKHRDRVWARMTPEVSSHSNISPMQSATIASRVYAY